MRSLCLQLSFVSHYSRGGCSFDEADKATLSNCGFNLTKWILDNQTVVDSGLVEDCFKVSNLQAFGDAVDERVLGLHWDLTFDELQIKANILLILCLIFWDSCLSY